MQGKCQRAPVGSSPKEQKAKEARTASEPHNSAQHPTTDSVACAAAGPPRLHTFPTWVPLIGDKSRLLPLAVSKRRECGLLLPRAPNGPVVKLHGQGPRAEARAARGALHVRRANARRVTP